MLDRAPDIVDHAGPLMVPWTKKELGPVEEFGAGVASWRQNAALDTSNEFVNSFRDIDSFRATVESLNDISQSSVLS